MKYAQFVSAMCGVVLAVSGCAAVVDAVKPALSNDLTRTSELAAKYDKPEVKQCADFLNTALNAEDSTMAKLDELLKEPTDGLLSAALKAALVADYVRGLNDPARSAKFQKDFDTNCKAVAGQLVINIARDARKIATRRVGG